MTAARQDIGTNPRQPFMSGDSRIIEIGPILDQNGAVVDIANSAIKWEIYASDGAGGFTGAALVTKQVGTGVTITGSVPAGMFIRVQLLPADTEPLAGDYYHEAEATFPGGTVHTVTTGVFRITRDAIQ